jgi:hypothetical protein
MATQTQQERMLQALAAMPIDDVWPAGLSMPVAVSQLQDAFDRTNVTYTLASSYEITEALKTHLLQLLAQGAPLPLWLLDELRQEKYLHAKTLEELSKAHPELELISAIRAMLNEFAWQEFRVRFHAAAQPEGSIVEIIFVREDDEDAPEDACTLVARLSVATPVRVIRQFIAFSAAQYQLGKAHGTTQAQQGMRRALGL